MNFKKIETLFNIKSRFSILKPSILTQIRRDNESSHPVQDRVLQNEPCHQDDHQTRVADHADGQHVDLSHVSQSDAQVEQTGDDGPHHVNGGAVQTQDHIRPVMELSNTGVTSMNIGEDLHVYV